MVDVPESRVIDFEPFVGKPTKAVNDIDLENLATFYTYGANSDQTGANFNAVNADFHGDLFNGNTMSKVDNTNNYSYPQAEWKKWEMDNYYRFAAYSNGNVKLATGVTAFWNESRTIKVKNAQGDLVDQTLNNLWGLTIADYERGDKDLLIAVAAERNTVGSFNATQSPVNFTFEHALAKVIFRFQYTKDSQNPNLRMKIREFNVNAITKATCDAFYESTQHTYINWDSQYKSTVDINDAGKKGDIAYFSGGKLITENNTAGLPYNFETDVYYMIPQKNNITIAEIVVETIDDNGTDDDTTDDRVTALTKYENVSLEITNHIYWLPGYVYRYTASLTPSQDYIEFVASVNGWDDEADRDAGINGTTGASE